MNIRIKKHHKGWVSEYQKAKWTLFGLKYYWTHYISVTGMSDVPWYFKTKESAESETLLKLKWDIIKNSKK